MGMSTPDLAQELTYFVQETPGPAFRHEGGPTHYIQLVVGMEYVAAVPVHGKAWVITEDGERVEEGDPQFWPAFCRRLSTVFRQQAYLETAERRGPA